MLCTWAKRIDFFHFRFTGDIFLPFTRLKFNLTPAENKTTTSETITMDPNSAINPTTTSPPLSQQSTLLGDSTSEEASIAPNVSSDSLSQPHDATLAPVTQSPIYEQGTPFGLGLGTSDPFIQDQDEAPTQDSSRWKKDALVEES